METFDVDEKIKIRDEISHDKVVENHVNYENIDENELREFDGEMMANLTEICKRYDVNIRKLMKDLKKDEDKIMENLENRDINFYHTHKKFGTFIRWQLLAVIPKYILDSVGLVTRLLGKIHEHQLIATRFDVQYYYEDLKEVHMETNKNIQDKLHRQIKQLETELEEKEVELEETKAELENTNKKFFDLNGEWVKANQLIRRYDEWRGDWKTIYEWFIYKYDVKMPEKFCKMYDKKMVDAIRAKDIDDEYKYTPYQIDKYFELTRGATCYMELVQLPPSPKPPHGFKKMSPRNTHTFHMSDWYLLDGMTSQFEYELSIELTKQHKLPPLQQMRPEDCVIGNWQSDPNVVPLKIGN